MKKIGIILQSLGILIVIVSLASAPSITGAVIGINNTSQKIGMGGLILIFLGLILERKRLIK